MHSEQDLNLAIEKYADTVKRLCVVYLKNNADTEDVFQTVFMKYLLSNKHFDNDDHEKAWFIRVTINCCKDLLKSFFRKKTVPLDEALNLECNNTLNNSDVLDAVLSLPKKYKEVIYLYFYEDYSAVEIAKLLDKNVNTIYTHLSRAKSMLKEKLGGERFE